MDLRKLGDSEHIPSNHQPAESYVLGNFGEGDVQPLLEKPFTGALRRLV
jgi:hypothetical protein